MATSSVFQDLYVDALSVSTKMRMNFFISLTIIYRNSPTKTSRTILSTRTAFGNQRDGPAFDESWEHSADPETGRAC